MIPAGLLSAAHELTLPAFALAALLIAFVAVVRVWPQVKRAQADSDASLRADLLARVKVLEETNAKDRDACEERVTRLEQRHDRAISDLRADLEEKVSTIRHDRNGLRQVLNFILSGIKKIDHPELRDVAAEAEEMLARHDELLAVEKGAAVGARRRPK